MLATTLMLLTQNLPQTKDNFNCLDWVRSLLILTFSHFTGAPPFFKDKKGSANPLKALQFKLYKTANCKIFNYFWCFLTSSNTTADLTCAPWQPSKIRPMAIWHILFYCLLDACVCNYLPANSRVKSKETESRSGLWILHSPHFNNTLPCKSLLWMLTFGGEQLGQHYCIHYILI